MPDDDEMQATKDALNKIIDSNGDLIDEAITEWNMAVWGQSFVNQTGSTPFNG